VAEWVFANRVVAGRDTDTLTNSDAIYLPLVHMERAYGVVGIKREQSFTVEERVMLEAMASQLALVLAKQHLLEAVKSVELTEKSNQLHRALLDSVSHELKTPVTVLQTAFDTLFRKNDFSASDEIKTLFSETRIALSRLRRVVDNLLEMTKLESGIFQPINEWCDVQELLESTIESLQGELRNCRVEIKINSPTNNPVSTDPHLIEHILHNLLTNAVAHSPPNAVIELSASVECNLLSLSVSDKGEGILPSDLPHIFTQFYRGEGSKPGGLGLGLSIVDRMVRILGGRVTASNRLDGTGAIFVVSLPLDGGLPPPKI